MNKTLLSAALLVALSALTLSACGSESDENASLKAALRLELSEGITASPAEVKDSICSNQEGAVEGVVRTAQVDDEYQALSTDDVAQIAREVFQEACKQ